eukprot:5481146-Pyramimonas_sp.AAC.1
MQSKAEEAVKAAIVAQEELDTVHQQLEDAKARGLSLGAQGGAGEAKAAPPVSLAQPLQQALDAFVGALPEGEAGEGLRKAFDTMRETLEAAAAAAEAKEPSAAAAAPAAGGTAPGGPGPAGGGQPRAKREKRGEVENAASAEGR